MAQSQSLHKLFLIASLLMASLCTLAQGTTDDQLAAFYYREGSYDKAVLYYERLYESRPSNDNYQYYLNCLLALEEFKEAERLAEAQSKLVPTAFSYKVDIGRIHELSGDENKADRHYDRLIKDLDNASVNQILDLGKAFTDISKNDRALEVYYKGRKMIGKAYPFHFQIAQILGQQGDIEGMVTEYLDVLEVSKGYLQSVQNTLNRVIGFDESNKYNAILEAKLMERVQRNAEDDIYAQMLVWMLVRQNRYETAMIQVKAIDKRNREDGGRVINLAKLAADNYKYAVAIEGYEYVKQKGPANYYYSDAVIGLLKALNSKITQDAYDEASIQKLVTTYSTTLEEFGERAATWEIIRDFAHIKAFYQSRYVESAVNEAIDMLKHSLAIPGLDERQLAALKLELADIYVLKGRIWDASLLYGQVEKRFKYDEIGFEAKLKNAKVFYYSGDFGWSEAQLDVLKGSTSKLIANDAMELSTFISDNSALDTTTEALSVFAKSELLLAQHKYDSALYMLSLIESNFPGHALADNILFQRAKIAFEQGEYQKAAERFLKVADTYSYDILADNALIEAGRIYEEYLHNNEEAMAIYERILTDFPGSLYVIEARKRFRALRGDAIN